MSTGHKEMTMTISKEEVYKDYLRFLRHEAMRANCKEWDITKIIEDGKAGNF